METGDVHEIVNPSQLSFFLCLSFGHFLRVTRGNLIVHMEYFETSSLEMHSWKHLKLERHGMV